MAVDLGDLYRCSFTNTSPAGGNVSAGTMTLTITLPDLTTTVITPVAPISAGVYQHDYQTVQAGRHIARWVGTGANPGAHVEAFDVRPASVPYIVSLADIKQQLNMTSTADDEELRAYLEAATGVIETHLGRAVVRRTFVEQHATSGEILLGWTPVVSVTSVVSLDGATTWNVADLNVASGILRAGPNGTALTGDVVVTYVAGAAVVPANWALAARIIVQHLWETQRGTKGGPRAGGLETPGAGFTQYGFSIPNRAKELLTGGLAGV